jgi:eukaryotic-like serine/threonine-protein kinase
MAYSWVVPFVVAAASGSCDSSTGPGPKGVVERWYKTQPGYGRARPAVSGTLVYFGTGDGQVIARDVNTGSARWSAAVSKESVDGANLFVRANIVIAPSVFNTTALDAQTGQKLWSYQAPRDTVGVPPAMAAPGQVVDSRIDADNEMVYIPAWGASVSAVDIRTGAVRWVWQPGRIDGDTAASGVFRSGSMGVRVSGDTVFATMWHSTNRFGGTSEAWLVAVAKQTGAELWRVKLPFQGSGALIESAPALYQNLVIVHTLSAKTYAVDRTTRQIAWSFIAPGYTISTIAGPEVYGSTVYVDGGDDAIYALRANDGSVIWRGAFSTATSRDLLITDRHLIIITGHLHIMDRQSGKEIVVTDQPYTYDPLIASPAAASNGRVFVAVAGGAWCFEEP